MPARLLQILHPILLLSPRRVVPVIAAEQTAATKNGLIWAHLNGSLFVKVARPPENTGLHALQL
jgi:hypothetical protein